MGLYAANGSFNVTVVDGSTWTGAQAPDGSLYVVEDTGSSFVGLEHPCGAMRVKVASAGTRVPFNSPNGSNYVYEGTPAEAAAIGAMPITVVSGSFGTVVISTAFLMEDGSSFILLESGDYMLQE